MSHPSSGQGRARSIGSKTTLRLTALGLLSLTLMACGTVPQAPSSTSGQAQTKVQPQILPCAESVTPQAGEQPNLVSCDPPDPGPSPDPTPTPTPAPTRPDITPEMATALQQAGLAGDPYSVGQTYTRSCTVALYTRGSDSTTCTLAGLKSTTLRSDTPNYRAVRINIPSQHNCRWTETQLPDGGSVQSITEVDNIYGRAIDAALKVGNVDLAAKLGQMREYHRSVIMLSSESPIIQVTFYARADSWWTGRGGNCNGTVEADFVWR